MDKKRCGDPSCHCGLLRDSFGNPHQGVGAPFNTIFAIPIITRLPRRPAWGGLSQGERAGSRERYRYRGSRPCIRPISLLTLSLPTLLDSNFPGNPLWAGSREYLARSRGAMGAAGGGARAKPIGRLARPHVKLRIILVIMIIQIMMMMIMII